MATKMERFLCSTNWKALFCILSTSFPGFINNPCTVSFSSPASGRQRAHWEVERWRWWWWGCARPNSLHVEVCRLGKWEVQEAGVRTGERKRGHLLTCRHPLNPSRQAGHQLRPPLCLPALMPKAQGLVWCGCCGWGACLEMGWCLDGLASATSCCQMHTECSFRFSP